MNLKLFYKALPLSLGEKKEPAIKKLKRLFYFTCILIVGMLNVAEAQHAGVIKELLPDFFIGKTVYTQEKKQIQITLLPSYWKREELAVINIPMQFEYGLTNRFQVELELPYGFKHPLVGQNFNGAGNAEVGFLYSILNTNKPFALAVGFNAGLPTAKSEKGTDDEEMEWVPSLTIAKQMGKVQIHASVSAEITKHEAGFNYYLATVFPLANWRATLELNGKINDNKTIYLTPGIIWKGLDDFQFGAGISKEITKYYSSWACILMISHEFSLRRRQ